MAEDGEIPTDPPSAYDPNDPHNFTMPLVEHLVELRQRLIYSLVAVVVLFFVCYAFSREIYAFLVQPLADVVNANGEHRRLIFTALHEAFLTYVKVSFFAALFIAFPFILTQIWRFVAPGLYKHEKRAEIGRAHV